MKIEINIPKNLEPFVESARQASGSAAESAKEYMVELLEQELQAKTDARVIEVASSWRPVDSVEVLTRKQLLVEKLKSMPVETLSALEVIVSAEEP